MENPREFVGKLDASAIDELVTSGKRVRFDAALAAALLEHLALGAPVLTSCGAAGVSELRYYAWIARGEKAREAEDAGRKIRERDVPFRDFAIAAQRAQALAIIDLHSQIRKAAETDWRAAAYLLERIAPENYGKRVTVHVGRDASVGAAEAEDAALRRARQELDDDDATM